VRSAPGVVALGHETAEASLLAAVLEGEVDERVDEGVEGDILVVEAQAAEFVEDALVRREVVSRAGEALQFEQAGIGGIEGQDVLRKVVKGGSSAEVALIAVDLLGLAPSPIGGGAAERGEALLEG